MNRSQLGFGVESRLTWIKSRHSNWLDLSVRHRTWLDTSAGIAIDLFFCVGVCGGRKLLGLSVWIEINLVLFRRIKIDFTIEWGSNFDLISMLGQNELDVCLGDRSSLGFRMGGLNCLVFCLEDRTWFDFSVGIGIDLLHVCGPKITWF